MASFKYTKGWEKIHSGGVNFPSDTIKASLVKTGTGHYIASESSDEFFDAISSGDVIATVTITGVSVTGGKLTFTPPKWTAPTSGAIVGAVIIWKSTGTDSTSPLLINLEGDIVSYLPWTLTGDDFTYYPPLAGVFSK